MDERAQTKFDEWRSKDQANADAFARAVGIWDAFDYVGAEPHLWALREAALAAGAEPRRHLWLGVGAGIAASLQAMVLLATIFLGQASLPSLPQKGAGHVERPIAANLRSISLDYMTAKGELRKIDLADGSRVTLNTDSAIRVAFAADQRLITLLRGQALFEVAKQHGRPFVVQAGNRQITALGTVFDVRLDHNRTQVTLVEGKVVIDGLTDGTIDSLIAPTVLTPGHELIVVEGVTQALTKVDVDQQLLWRDGFVEFADTPLLAAVHEMNRYSSVQMVVADADTGRLGVSGIFRTGNPERFAEILAELLPLRARKLPNGTIEIRRGSLAGL